MNGEKPYIYTMSASKSMKSLRNLFVKIIAYDLNCLLLERTRIVLGEKFETACDFSSLNFIGDCFLGQVIFLFNSRMVLRRKGSPFLFILA